MSDPGSDNEEVLDVGRQWVAPAWLRRPTRYLRRTARQIPSGARWALLAAAAVGLFGYGVARPAPHPATGRAPDAPAAPAAPLPVDGTASHYPGLLQEYDEQRAWLARVAPPARHFGHRLR